MGNYVTCLNSGSSRGRFRLYLTDLNSKRSGQTLEIVFVHRSNRSTKRDVLNFSHGYPSAAMGGGLSV